jgi:hypothetical protein
LDVGYVIARLWAWLLARFTRKPRGDDEAGGYWGGV